MNNSTIKVLSLGCMSSFIYNEVEYILVKVSDGGFNFITPTSPFYQLPQHFYTSDYPSPEEIDRICNKYLGKEIK